MLGSVATTCPPMAEQPMSDPTDAERVRRMRVAAYLYQLAEAIRKGEIQSFKAEWDDSMEDLQVDLVPVFGVNSDR